MASVLNKMELEQGWVDVTEEYNTHSFRPVERAFVDKTDPRNPFPTNTLDIVKVAENKYRISFSGWYLYLKDEVLIHSCIEDAEKVAAKIMKYVNYGRYELGITQLPR